MAKKSLRETLLMNQNALDAWAVMFGKNPMIHIDIPPKRKAPTKKSNNEDLEASVLKAVGELLSSHPRVLFAVRQNSGAAYLKGKNGADVPVWFYKFARSQRPMRISDFWGMTTDGKMFAIECKRPSWKSPNGHRELEQMAFIDTVRGAGGIGGFATSVSDAMMILEQKR